MRIRNLIVAATLGVFSAAGAAGAIVGTTATAGATDIHTHDLVSGPKACAASGGSYTGVEGNSSCTYKDVGSYDCHTETNGGAQNGEAITWEECSFNAK
jgi:hypothetical protein